MHTINNKQLKISVIRSVTNLKSDSTIMIIVKNMSLIGFLKMKPCLSSLEPGNYDNSCIGEAS